MSEVKPYDGPATLPDVAEAELKQIAVDFHKGLIFSNLHIRPGEDIGHVFMIIGLGGFADHPESYVKSIGLAYEYLDKAGPRAVNGLPMFLSMRLLNKSDTKKMFEIVKKLEKAEKDVLNDRVQSDR